MRRFSRDQKLVVEMVSGRTGQADHVYPWSHGGKSVIENCQIVTGNMNQVKGNKVFQPREWQIEFFEQWQKRARSKPFLLIAIPGGGKTLASLEVARRWLAAGADRRLLVVVPTRNLREQWKDEAAQLGLNLQTKEFGTSFKDDFQGGVTTYQGVASNPQLYRYLCSVHKIMVIFDEVHHCGDEASFGVGVQQAFSDHAEEKLLMSGTPWRSTGTAIPFVQYDANGFAIGDYCYDYPSALTDGVVRYLVFDYSKGKLTNDLTGETKVLQQDISDSDASERLAKILDADGDFARQQILLAHRKLEECRKTTPDAGALAVCIDRWHAAKVAQLIKNVTGCEPSVILNDEDLTNDSVREFRKSKKEWLVAVRMVSEGTDIKRLQVLCYLTNTTSELFFRQVVGRVSRVRGGEDFEGYVYLPADPRLIRCAQNIENAQVRALRQQNEQELREINERQQNLSFDTYTTSHEGTDIVFIGAESLSPDKAKEVEHIAEQSGLSMQKVLQVLALAGQASKFSTMQESGSVLPKEDRLDSLRKKCQKKANHLARLLDEDVKNIHARFKPQKEMSESELHHKFETLVREIERNSRE